MKGEAGRLPAADAHADIGHELLVGLEAREARDVTCEPVEEDVLVPPQDALRVPVVRRCVRSTSSGVSGRSGVTSLAAVTHAS